MARKVNARLGTKSVAHDDGNHTKKTIGNGTMMHEESAVAPVHGNISRYMIDKNTMRDNYIMVDGDVYAVGSAARRARRTRPTGAQRYTRDYYRVGLAYMLGKLFGGDSVDVDLHATHAPQDYDFIPNMVDSVSGVIDCVTSNGKAKFSVQKFTSYDEPIGAANAVFFNPNGVIDNYWRVGHHIILVIDIGGFTTDYAVIENGVVDPEAMKSVEFGADNIYKMFIKGVRKSDVLRQKLGSLSETNYVPEMVKEAILTGKWGGDSRNPIDVSDVSNDVLNYLLSEVEDGIESMGGLVNYTDGIFSGGGSGLSYTEFVNRHIGNPITFHIAESNNSLLRYANIMGVQIGAKKDGLWYE